MAIDANILNKLTFLYVEDDQLSVTFFEKFMKKRGFTYHIARDGIEGLEKFKEVSPDIIITDINMPRMDGIEMIGEIKKIKSDVPVVITSAFNEQEYTQQAKDFGIEHFLVKPFLFKELTDAIIASVESSQEEAKKNTVESYKVLLVDDHETNRRSLKFILDEFENIEIFEAEDGLEAVNMSKNQVYDLIFMDVMMPNIDGIESTRKIKAIQPKALVVGITALDDKDTSLKMMESGSEDYVTKPFDSDILEQRIKNYFRLIDLRKISKQSEIEAVNLFNKKVYHRALFFRIEDESALSEFWEYYLGSGLLPVRLLHDHIRLLFAFGSWLVKSGCQFKIFAEENGTYYYLTITGIENISELIVRSIILKSEVNTQYMMKAGKLSFVLRKIAQNEPDDEKSENKDETPVLVANVDALSYLSTLENYEKPVSELFETEDDIDNLILKLEASPDHDTLALLAQSYYKYAKNLERLKEFSHLSYALVNLGTFLEGLDESQMNQSDSLKMMVTLLMAILSDFSAWRIGIFSTKSTDDIHYWDQSLVSAMLQIEMLFATESINDGEIEFF
jgi:DNA-binding response OmpR family regulator